MISQDEQVTVRISKLSLFRHIKWHDSLQRDLFEGRVESNRRMHFSDNMIQLNSLTFIDAEQVAQKEKMEIHGSHNLLIEMLFLRIQKK